MSDSDSSSDLELLQQIEEWDAQEMPRGRRTYIRMNYMVELDGYEFAYRFRLSKAMVEDLLIQIYPYLKVTSTRNHGVPPLHQLLLALRFYALGTMLVAVADFIGVSIASACRIVTSVSEAIARLYPIHVRPHEHTQLDFYNIAGFPKVHGVVDGTHITIQSPDSNIGEEFRNRKGYFSLNVQGICNAHLVFLNVVARWPGSTHDATIFSNSVFGISCQYGLLENRWLLGDSAYPCKPYLLTPLLHPTTANELRYNESHIKTRNTIERCFGVWKRRFPVLGLKMRLSREHIQTVIIAAAVLHNICRRNNMADLEPEVELPVVEDNTSGPPSADYVVVNERQQLIDSYFN